MAASDESTDLDDVAQVEAFEFSPRMSAADALMWDIEKDPLLRSTITFVTLLDQVPDRDRFVRVMDRATRLVPRLRQRVVGHPYSIAPPRWEADTNFDLSYHLRFMRAPSPTSSESNDPAGSAVRQVLDIAEPIAMQGFDRARPLWEMTLVDGLTGGKAAVIGKVHHAISDGVGGVNLQMSMLSLERDPVDQMNVSSPMPDAPTPSALGETQRIIDATLFEARKQMEGIVGTAAAAIDTLDRFRHDPVGVGVDAVRTGGSLIRLLSPATKPLSPLMTNRSLSVHFDTITVPVDTMKDAARIVSGKLNDSFVAAVAGGLRRYHVRHGHADTELLRMTMPINVRTEGSAGRAGNQFVPARFPVPISIDDPVMRMNAIRTLVAHQRAEPALALSDPIANVLHRLPTTATTAVFGSMLKGIDFVTSNVPGPPFTVFLAGAEVEGQIALGPLTGSAANMTLLSYRHDLNIGINVDPAAIPDPAVFTECLRDSFDEILKLA